MVAKVAKKVSVKSAPKKVAAAPKKAAAAPKKAAAKAAKVGQAAAVRAATEGEFVVPPPPHDDQIYIMQSLPGFQVRTWSCMRAPVLAPFCKRSDRSAAEVRNGYAAADHRFCPRRLHRRCSRARRRACACTRT